MKKRLIMISALVLALVLALFALTACNSANSEIGEELVINGDFSNFDEDEKKFEGWTTSTSSVTFGRGYTSSDPNNNYLYIDNGSSKKFSYMYQTINVNAGKIYKVSVDMLISSALTSKSGAYVMFTENMSSDNWFAAHSAVTNGFVTTTFYVRPQNTDYLTIALCLGNDENGSSGRVQFDNVSVQRVDKNSVPSGETVHNFRKTSAIMATSTTSGLCFVILLTLFTVAVFVAIYIVVRRLYARRDAFVDFDNGVTATKKGVKTATGTKWYKNFIFIAVLLTLGTFLIRLVMLLTTYGMGTTMNNVVNNAVTLGKQNGVFNFFSTYPTATLAPGEMYILAVVGAIFGNANRAAEISIMIRFINVLADMAVVLMIYFYGRKYVGNKLSTVYASLYAVLPIVFTMSGFNGTFESLLVALMLGAVILMVEKKYLATYFMLTLATVLDMRAMAIAPIAVAYFVYRYIKDDSDMRKFTANRAMIVFGLVGAFVLGYLLTLPVGINQIAQGDAFFNFKMMVQQITGTTFFVSNAFNLYSMVAMNNKTISQQGVTILNLVFLLVLEAYVISLYFKNRNKQELILLVSFVLAVIAVFTLKVDYTYLFLSIVFAIIYTMISGDRRMYWVVGGYATLGFLDIAQLLNQSKWVAAYPTTGISNYETTNPFYITFCVLTVLLTAYYVYVTYSITNNGKISDIRAMAEPFRITFKNSIAKLGAKLRSKNAD